MHRTLAAGLAAGALLWSAAILLAPLALASHHPSIAVPAAFLYQTAGLICHQRPERSFHLAGVQLPVCGRCAGLYFGAAAAALPAWVLPIVPAALSRQTRTILAIAALPTAATVALEFAGLVFPSNLTRALSAGPLGAAAAWIFIRSLKAERTTMTPTMSTEN
jgi:uncharacterized membrane protein